MPTMKIFLVLFLIPTILFSQSKSSIPTGVFHGPYSAPLFSSTTIENIKIAHWDISMQSFAEEEQEGNSLHIKSLKAAKMKEKIKSLSSISTQNQAQKTRAINPIIGTNFQGNPLATWTPTDNSVAVSNGGQIVNCINNGIGYYDTSGTTIVQNQTWDAFVNNTTLNQAKFDPRVIYDNKHDRFIVTLLHGFSSTKSKILVCFSKTNNPMDGWNIYQLSGNPFNDSSWTDYPTIGVNDDDLFINGNMFGDAGAGYPFKGTYIYQINLDSGYVAGSLQYGLWNQIYSSDGTQGVTLYPATEGQGNSLKEKMFFVHLQPDSGSYVYLYEINGKLHSPNKTLTASQYAIPHYEVCADAFQKDPSTGFIDSLSTGSSWTENAFYLNRQVHFTFCADIGSGWCGIHYGRILLDSNVAHVTAKGQIGTDLAYPAIASFGYDTLDQGAVIAYLQSDTSMTPQNGVFSINHAMTWSSLQTVKTGDTCVNILYPPAYAIQPERWGDYTGICRKYNSLLPQAWMAAAYGANTPPRLASYGTWIAQIFSAESPIPTITKDIQAQNNKWMIYPNPISDLFTIEFDNEKAGEVNISLIDASGKLVRILFDDYLKESKNKLSFNKMMLAPGNYFVIIKNEGQKIGSKNVVIQ